MEVLWKIYCKDICITTHVEKIFFYIPLMLPSDFIDCLDVQDLPSEPLRVLAGQIGVSNVVRLWDMLRGRSVSFPASFPHCVIAKWLRKQNKLNISEAAWKLGVSSRKISAVANEWTPKSTEQMSLF